MADLVTHLCTALLPAALLPDGHPRRYLAPLVAFGTVLPDLFGRAVPLALEHLYLRGWPVPEELLWPWSALHEPAGWLLVSALLSALFVDRQRRAAFGALAVGCALHTALDLLQDHRGEGYLIFAPFSLRDVELGLMGSEATVDRAEIVCAATAAAALPRLVDFALGAPARPFLWALFAVLFAAVGFALHPSPGWAASAAAFCASSWPWWRRQPLGFLALSLGALATAVLW